MSGHLRGPEHDGDVVVALPNEVEHAVPGVHLHIRGDALLLEQDGHCLGDRRHFRAAGVAQDAQRQLLAVLRPVAVGLFVAGLAQERGGGLSVDLIRLDLFAPPREGGGKEGPGRRPDAVERALDDEFPVDEQVHRLADAHVVQNALFAGVEGAVVEAGAFVLVDLETVVARQAGDVGGKQVHDEVDLARLQRQRAGVVVGNVAVFRWS